MNIQDKQATTNNFPIMSVLAKNPNALVAISKAVEQPTNTGASSIRSVEDGAVASLSELSQVSRGIQQNIQNYESFFELFPDMNIDRSIWTGGVLSPNNMFREDLNFSIENDIVPGVVAGKIIQIIQEDIEKKYGFVGELRKIVDNAAFNFGSHVKLVLPEAAVDYLINNRSGLRFESHSNLRAHFAAKENRFSMGLLSNPPLAKDGADKSATTYRNESYQQRFENYDPKYNPSFRWETLPEHYRSLIGKAKFEVTDDFSIIKLPLYQQMIERENIRSRIDSQRKAVNTFRLESMGQQTRKLENDSGVSGPRVTSYSSKDIEKSPGELTPEKLRAAIFKTAPTDQEIFRRVPRLANLTRHSIGQCLYIDAPSEAFIPVHYPGQPGKHAGYLALLDVSSGYFLTLESQRRILTNFNGQSNLGSGNSGGQPGSNSSIGTSITDKARQNLTNPDRSAPLRFHPEIFGSVLVGDFLDRLNTKNSGFEVEAEMTSAMSYVMMARANAGHQTQVLYLPIDFVSYFAFDHNANGTGRSLLAGVQNLLSLRAAALYSRVANQIRNAISITDVNIQLDPRDHAPQRSLMKIVDLVTQSRSQFFPWGLNTASDIWSWWNRAGYQLNIEGHPALPTTKVSYAHRANDHHIPDIADDGYLKDMVGHHFGITPEMKDAGEGADFATSIANNNILFSQRCLANQQKLNPQITAHVRRIAFNDSEIFGKVRSVIKEAWAEIVASFDDRTKMLYEGVDEDNAVDSFHRLVIDSLKAILPPPEVTTVENQFTAFKAFCEAVDHAFDQTLADEALTADMFGTELETAIAHLNQWKSQIKRDWMQKNGYMQELFDVASINQDNKPDSKLAQASKEFTLAFAKNLLVSLRDYKVIGAAVAKDIGILTGAIEPDTPQEENTQTDPNAPTAGNTQEESQQPV